MSHQAPFSWLHVRGGRRGGPSPWFQILQGWTDDATFRPAGSAAAVTRPTLRLRIQRVDRPSKAPWYDISPSTLQAQLSGYVRFQSFNNVKFRVRAYGQPPQKRFSLEIQPL